MRAHAKKKPATLDSLIATEWDTLNDLKKMLQNPDLSVPEKIRAANALAYHASVLNKLLAQKGGSSQFNDATLGEFIKGVGSKIARRVRKDFIKWTRRLSLVR